MMKYELCKSRQLSAVCREEIAGCAKAQWRNKPTEGEKTQWPNEAISSQDEGREDAKSKVEGRRDPGFEEMRNKGSCQWSVFSCQ